MELRPTTLKNILLLILVLFTVLIIAIVAFNGDGHYHSRQTTRFSKYALQVHTPGDTIPTTTQHSSASNYSGGPLPKELVNQKRLLFSSSFSYSFNDTPKELYLFIPTAEYANSIYINGELLFQCGDLHSDNAISKFWGERVLIPASLLKEGKNSFQVIVAPQGFRIELPNFELGSYKAITKRTLFYTIGHYGTHFAFTILSLFLFILFFSLWLIQKPREASILIFATTSFSLSLAYFTMILSSAATDTLFLWKISRIGFVSATVLILLFSLKKTGRAKGRVAYILTGTLLTLTIGLFLNCSSKQDVITLFMRIAPILITPTMILVPILFLLDYKKHRQNTTLILLVCSTANSLTALHDLILKRQFIDADVWLVPYGFFAIQFGIALIFVLDMKKTYDVLKAQKETLERNQRELIIARDQANSANMAKGQFLAKMSHEIRTPLNGVIGMHELLLGTSLTSEQSQYIDIIQKSSVNLLSIINDILDFSKIEAGKMDLKQGQFSLRNLLLDIIKAYQGRAREQGLYLNTEISGNIGNFYLGDEHRLKQLFENLLNNALKFTESGAITIKGVALSQGVEEDLLQFSISDTGIGMTKEQQEEVFQSFTQGDSSTTRVYGGTGLGLTICKQLIELMHGKLTLQSELHKGSSFTFSLKLKHLEVVEFTQKKAPNLEDTVPLKETLNKKEIHILLAEDNPVNQKVATGLIQKLGYSTSVVNNGEEAINELEKRHYHIVFMDCQMPIIDGYEATKKLRKKGVATPIIALTANAMAGDKEKCLESGMNNYIAKPIHAVDLKKMIEKYTTPLP